MRDIIVTIGREYGSGGRLIGKMVAEKLGIPFYDKELIALVIKDGIINKQVVNGLDETTSKKFFYGLPEKSFMPSQTESTFDLTMNDRLFLAQSKAIKNIAENGSAVIVGRGADYILRDNPNVLKVFIHAHLDYRVKQAIKFYDINPSAARKFVQKMDDQRQKYYTYYAGKKWGIAEHYDLCINSSLGWELTAEIIAMTAKSKL